MQYADNRELRARLYRAYATRAAEIDNGYSKPEWDNGPLIKRILELRAEDAQMLGFRNFAEVSLVPKMADTPEQVLAFLRDWRPRPSPSPRRTWPNCAPSPRTNWASPTSSPGMPPTSRKSCCRRATPSPSRK
jgi:Zn-dependent oligopeptidase